MIGLIIIASLLALAFAGTSWILILVVKQNQDLRAEGHRKDYRLELEVRRGEDLYLALRNRDKTVMELEDAAVTLHLENQKEREAARNMFERVITKMLERQIAAEAIAGGGGSADPEDEYVETPGPLKLVQDG